MYNGRRRHIQTESIQDQSVKEESVHGHRDGGEKRFETCQERSSQRQKTKHLAEREIYKEQNSFCSSQKKKKKIINAMLHLVPRL